MTVQQSRIQSTSLQKWSVQRYEQWETLASRNRIYIYVAAYQRGGSCVAYP